MFIYCDFKLQRNHYIVKIVRKRILQNAFETKDL